MPGVLCLERPNILGGRPPDWIEFVNCGSWPAAHLKLAKWLRRTFLTFIVSVVQSSLMRFMKFGVLEIGFCKFRPFCNPLRTRPQYRCVTMLLPSLLPVGDVLQGSSDNSNFLQLPCMTFCSLDMSQPSSSTPLLPRLGSALLRPNPSVLWKSGAVLAATGMLAGAFGAHGLQQRKGITAENIRAWATASHYAVFNGLALLLVSMHPRFANHRFAGPAIAAGGAIFSGSIMALVLARDR
ncbi:hypothetical protein AcW1_000810 [Taiwanofungus camphoratus]|nr:hypothetical protein AcV7_000830 [Antrodia cinnamomea]KAI0963846.1 hypothetical protein AcW1_000810 [Antrodia cinnamomea]